MKNRLMLSIFGMILLIVIMSSVNAEIKFWQEQWDMGNGTIKTRANLVYSKGGFGYADDYVTGDNPYEAYLLYNIYVKKHNAESPNFAVNNCTLNIYFFKKSQSSVMVYNKTYTEDDTDILGGKYFLQLRDGDGMYADEICSYQNTSLTLFNAPIFDIPANEQIITPSWECHACQYYEWSVYERSIISTDIIGNNVVSIVDYMQKFISLNFEILLYLFWLFMIAVLFFAIGMIFWGMYYVYFYLSGYLK
jgi:hypothetical protein